MSETGRRIPFLSAEELPAIREQILDLKPHWVPRHPRGIYYTLGASNYWDLVCKSQGEYRSEAHRLNAILWERFTPLYQNLKRVLAEALAAPVVYDPDVALPGFHVFQGNSLLTDLRNVTHNQWFRERDEPDQFINAIHCDTPHLCVMFGPHGIDKTRPLSFTGAISLPRAGSGLFTWDMTRDEGQSIPDEQLLDALSHVAKTYHPYNAGEIFMHGGLVYHQIARLENLLPGEERITLQGHLVLRDDGRWVPYW